MVSHEVVCAWCKEVMGQASVEGSHGICESCYRSAMGIPDLSPEQLDKLPFGVIIVDKEGKISSYNQAEERLSGHRQSDVIGKNFFIEVAPCTRVQEFQGRFQQFIASDRPVARFNFVFRFKQGDVAVGIMIVRLDEERAAITVKKSAQKAVKL